MAQTTFAGPIRSLSGVISAGYSGVVSLTADTTLTFGTAGDWHDGAADSYSGGAGWCYVGVKSNGDLKLLGDNPDQ